MQRHDLTDGVAELPAEKPQVCALYSSAPEQQADVLLLLCYFVALPYAHSQGRHAWCKQASILCMADANIGCKQASKQLLAPVQRKAQPGLVEFVCLL